MADQPTMLRRLQFAALLELEGHGFVDLPTIRTMVPGADIRDLETALQALLDDGSLESTGTVLELGTKVRHAAVGGLALTDKGRQRIAEHDV